MPNFMTIGQSVSEISRFFDFQIAAICHIGLLQLEILTADTMLRVKLRHRAKFRGERSNHS